MYTRVNTKSKQKRIQKSKQKRIQKSKQKRIQNVNKNKYTVYTKCLWEIEEYGKNIDGSNTIL